MCENLFSAPPITDFHPGFALYGKKKKKTQKLEGDLKKEVVGCLLDNFLVGLNKQVLGPAKPSLLWANEACLPQLLTEQML